jgi:hypothetical protein
MPREQRKRGFRADGSLLTSCLREVIVKVYIFFFCLAFSVKMSFFLLRRSRSLGLCWGFLLLLRFTSVTAEHFVLYGHCEPVPDILTFPRDQVCPRVQDGITSTSFPWTHNPTCINTKVRQGSGLKKETLCVYSNSRFAHGRGISLITTPEVATEYVLESFSHEDQEDRGNLLYEARQTEDRGMGLFATKQIRAGDSIMVKHPVLIIARDAWESPREDRHRLLEIAVQQLPEKTTKRFLDLAKSRGGFKLDDIVQTNSKRTRLGEIEHLAIVPEAAVSTYSYGMFN